MSGNEPVVPREIGEFSTETVNADKVVWEHPDGDRIGAERTNPGWLVYIEDDAGSRRPVDVAFDPEGVVRALRQKVEDRSIRDIRAEARGLSPYEQTLTDADIRQATNNAIKGRPAQALAEFFEDVNDIPRKSDDFLLTIPNVGPSTVDTIRERFEVPDDVDDDAEEVPDDAVTVVSPFRPLTREARRALQEFNILVEESVREAGRQTVVTVAEEPPDDVLEEHELFIEKEGLSVEQAREVAREYVEDEMAGGIRSPSGQWTAVRPEDWFEDAATGSNEVVSQWRSPEQSGGHIWVTVTRGEYEEEATFDAETNTTGDIPQVGSPYVGGIERDIEVALEAAINWMESNPATAQYPAFDGTISAGIFKPMVDVLRRLPGGNARVVVEEDEFRMWGTSFNHVELTVPATSFDTYNVTATGEATLKISDLWDVLKSLRFGDDVTLGTERSDGTLRWTFGGETSLMRHPSRGPTAKPEMGSDFAQFIAEGKQFRNLINAADQINGDSTAAIGLMDGDGFIEVEAEDGLEFRGDFEEISPVGEGVTAVRLDVLRDIKIAMARPSQTQPTINIEDRGNLGINYNQDGANVNIIMFAGDLDALEEMDLRPPRSIDPTTPEAPPAFRDDMEEDPLTTSRAQREIKEIIHRAALGGEFVESDDDPTQLALAEGLGRRTGGLRIDVQKVDRRLTGARVMIDLTPDTLGAEERSFALAAERGEPSDEFIARVIAEFDSRVDADGLDIDAINTERTVLENQYDIDLPAFGEGVEKPDPVPPIDRPGEPPGPLRESDDEGQEGTVRLPDRVDSGRWDVAAVARPDAGFGERYEILPFPDDDRWDPDVELTEDAVEDIEDQVRGIPAWQYEDGDIVAVASLADEVRGVRVRTVSVEPGVDLLRKRTTDRNGDLTVTPDDGWVGVHPDDLHDAATGDLQAGWRTAPIRDTSSRSAFHVGWEGEKMYHYRDTPQPPYLVYEWDEDAGQPIMEPMVGSDPPSRAWAALYRRPGQEKFIGLVERSDEGPMPADPVLSSDYRDRYDLDPSVTSGADVEEIIGETVLIRSSGGFVKEVEAYREVPDGTGFVTADEDHPDGTWYVPTSPKHDDSTIQLIGTPRADAAPAGSIQVGQATVEVPQPFGGWETVEFGAVSANMDAIDADGVFATYMTEDRDVTLTIEGTVASNKWKMEARVLENPVPDDRPAEGFELKFGEGGTDNGVEKVRLTHGNTTGAGTDKIIRDNWLSPEEVREQAREQAGGSFPWEAEATDAIPDGQEVIATRDDLSESDATGMAEGQIEAPIVVAEFTSGLEYALEEGTASMRVSDRVGDIVANAIGRPAVNRLTEGVVVGSAVLTDSDIETQRELLAVRVDATYLSDDDEEPEETEAGGETEDTEASEGPLFPSDSGIGSLTADDLEGTGWDSLARATVAPPERAESGEPGPRVALFNEQRNIALVLHRAELSDQNLAEVSAVVYEQAPPEGEIEPPSGTVADSYLIGENTDEPRLVRRMIADHDPNEVVATILREQGGAFSWEPFGPSRLIAEGSELSRESVIDILERATQGVNVGAQVAAGYIIAINLTADGTLPMDPERITIERADAHNFETNNRRLLLTALGAWLQAVEDYDQLRVEQINARRQSINEEFDRVSVPLLQERDRVQESPDETPDETPDDGGQTSDTGGLTRSEVEVIVEGATEGVDVTAAKKSENSSLRRITVRPDGSVPISIPGGADKYVAEGGRSEDTGSVIRNAIGQWEDYADLSEVDVGEINRARRELERQFGIELDELDVAEPGGGSDGDGDGEMTDLEARDLIIDAMDAGQFPVLDVPGRVEIEEGTGNIIIRPDVGMMWEDLLVENPGVYRQSGESVEEFVAEYLTELRDLVSKPNRQDVDVNAARRELGVDPLPGEQPEPEDGEDMDVVDRPDTRRVEVMVTSDGLDGNAYAVVEDVPDFTETVIVAEAVEELGDADQFDPQTRVGEAILTDDDSEIESTSFEAGMKVEETGDVEEGDFDMTAQLTPQRVERAFPKLFNSQGSAIAPEFDSLNDLVTAPLREVGEVRGVGDSTLERMVDRIPIDMDMSIQQQRERPLGVEERAPETAPTPRVEDDDGQESVTTVGDVPPGEEWIAEQISQGQRVLRNQYRETPIIEIVFPKRIQNRVTSVVANHVISVGGAQPFVQRPSFEEEQPVLADSLKSIQFQMEAVPGDEGFTNLQSTGYDVRGILQQLEDEPVVATISPIINAPISFN